VAGGAPGDFCRLRSCRRGGARGESSGLASSSGNKTKHVRTDWAPLHLLIIVTLLLRGWSMRRLVSSGEPQVGVIP